MSVISVPRRESLGARQRLERKLHHVDFLGRAREWEMLVRGGMDERAAAERAGLKIAAARSLLQYPDLRATLLPQDARLARQIIAEARAPDGSASAPAVDADADVDEEREATVSGPVSVPNERRDSFDEVLLKDRRSWMSNIPPTPHGWTDDQWLELHRVREAMRIESSRPVPASRPRGVGRRI